MISMAAGVVMHQACNPDVASRSSLATTSPSPADIRSQRRAVRPREAQPLLEALEGDGPRVEWGHTHVDSAAPGSGRQKSTNEEMATSNGSLVAVHAASVPWSPL